MSTVLGTGGAGCIGSHTCVELLQAGHPVAVFDNFSNSHPEALQRVRRISGKPLTLAQGDIRDQTALDGFLPLTEEHRLSAANPRGRGKLMIEDMLRGLFQAEPEWRIASLRCFNPVGAHPSGLIGEDPHGVPNNLMPFVAQVASGRRDHLNVWGSDYPTPDGTGVRDCIYEPPRESRRLLRLRMEPS